MNLYYIYLINKREENINLYHTNLLKYIYLTISNEFKNVLRIIKNSFIYNRLQCTEVDTTDSRRTNS